MIKGATSGHRNGVVALPAALPLPSIAVTSAAASDRLTAMFEAHFAFVWRSLRRLGVADASVDDATQEVFIVAARRLDLIEPGKEKSYLFGVAVRVAADARRSRNRRREDAVEGVEETRDPTPPIDELLDQRRARELLDQLVAALPDDTRAVFLLYELEGLTMAEISSMLDLPAGTVASRLRRGREDFAQRVAALTSPPPTAPRGRHE